MSNDKKSMSRPQIVSGLGIGLAVATATPALAQTTSTPRATISQPLSL